MLLQFSVKNFRSFRDEVTLKMVPASLRTKQEHIVTDSHNKKVEALPLAIFFGANASGKSNLIKAMDVAQSMILGGAESQVVLPVESFRLDVMTEQSPSRFEFIFKHDGVVYSYGFVATKMEVKEEWLFAYFTSQESKIFERVTNSQGKVDVESGPKLVGDTAGGQRAIRLIAGLTEKSQFFLTKACENNVNLVKPVLHWFRKHLTIIHPEAKYMPLEFRSYQDKDFSKHLTSFLREADTGISDLTCKTEDFDAEKHLAEVPKELRSLFAKHLSSLDFPAKSKAPLIVKLPFFALPYTFVVEKKSDESPPEIKVIKLQTMHQRDDGKEVTFELEDESDGTLRMLDLAPIFHEALTFDRVFVIDEIDRSLHTQLTKMMLNLCVSNAMKDKARGQFIVTSHDTNLIDLKVFRRDEIRFVQKDRYGVSQVTNLAEYKVPEGLNGENGYLEGRFGAIPALGKFEGILD